MVRLGFRPGRLIHSSHTSFVWSTMVYRPAHMLACSGRQFAGWSVQCMAAAEISCFVVTGDTFFVDDIFAGNLRVLIRSLQEPKSRTSIVMGCLR